MKIPWLSKKWINQKAQDVITEYESAIGGKVAPPIPVEDIIERGLNLKLGVIEIEDKTGLVDILGATYVKQRLVFVNATLLESRYEGRLNFTWAHEAGHWVLHRQFVVPDTLKESIQGTILCRSKDSKRPIEWQADYFAACLLMPELWIKEAFRNTYGPWPLKVCNTDSRLKGPIYFDSCARIFQRLQTGHDYPPPGSWPGCQPN